MKKHHNHVDSALFKKATSLLHHLESTAEDDEDPFHSAFSGWRPTAVDTGFQQGIKALRTLWDGLLKLNASEVVPKVLLDARKGYVCSAAQHVHAALAAEGLVNHIREDTVFQDKSEDSDVVMLDLEAEPQAREIDNDEVADNLQKKQVPQRRNKKRRKVARGVEQGSNGEGGVAISSLKATVHQDVPTDTPTISRSLILYFYKQTTVNRASAAVRA
ncbi:hypothetical protein BT69DRAFT_89098 [Atractiella rhizophila]|nr:hypothetical protein BT69DRAFT_89098 [Atractiella rhizophila]